MAPKQIKAGKTGKLPKMNSILPSMDSNRVAFPTWSQCSFCFSKY